MTCLNSCDILKTQHRRRGTRELFLVGDTVYSLFPGKEFDIANSFKNAAISGLFNAVGPTLRVDNKFVYNDSFLNYVKLPELKKICID